MEASVSTGVEELMRSIDNNIEYFDKVNKNERLASILFELKHSVETCALSVEEIEKFAPEYDFDERTSGNGYRSFVNIFESAVRKTSKVCRRLISNRRKILFRVDNYADELYEWNQIIDTLSHLCEALVVVHAGDEGRCLYTDCDSYNNAITKCLPLIDPKPFYGENIGFQFSSSMRPVIKFIVLSMASYYSFYYKSKPKALKVLRFPISFSKYFLYPKKRAAKYLHASQNSTTEYCRSFWFLNEGKIVHTAASVTGCKVKVNKVFKIPTKFFQLRSEKLDKMVDIPVPSSHIGLKPVQCRLISKQKRNGMFDVKTKPSNAKPSKYLIFHVHGGGWAAQTSKSHEYYLREWVSKLDVPMLSVDYSLTPEAPFPRAIEEVFYAYCWALNNPEVVGSTCENIVFVGDSAGGNLNTACVIKCIEMGIPLPIGLFNIYAPYSIGFTVSPSRFLSLIDPVLPYGFTTRLFKSYGQKHEKVDENDNKPMEIIENNVPKKIKKQKLRNVFDSPEQEFSVKVHDSPLLSPCLASEEILRQFPPTRMLSTNMDPCLDDSIEFGRILKRLGVPVQVDVLTGLAHGFLYFTHMSQDCHDGSKVCLERIRELLQMD